MQDHYDQRFTENKKVVTPLSELLKFSTRKCQFCNQEMAETKTIDIVVGKREQSRGPSLSVGSYGATQTMVTSKYYGFTPFSLLVCRKCLQGWTKQWHEKVWTDRIYPLGGVLLLSLACSVFVPENRPLFLMIVILAALVLFIAIWKLFMGAKKINSNTTMHMDALYAACDDNMKNGQIANELSAFEKSMAWRLMKPDFTLVWWHADVFKRDVEPTLQKPYLPGSR